MVQKRQLKNKSLFNDQIDRYNNNYKTTKSNLESHKKGYDQLILATNNQGKIIDEVEGKVLNMLKTILKETQNTLDLLKK